MAGIGRTRGRHGLVMGHGPCAFTFADVKRAVKAISEAGQPVARIHFPPDGGFTVMIGKPGESESGKINDSEVEDWIRKHQTNAAH